MPSPHPLVRQNIVRLSRAGVDRGATRGNSIRLLWEAAVNILAVQAAKKHQSLAFWLHANPVIPSYAPSAFITSFSLIISLFSPSRMALAKPTSSSTSSTNRKTSRGVPETTRGVPA
ncbi:hypothetical protein FBQ99_18165 [Chloroflexi bacterium CFX2]|nr:hypothetical protein [Chloroflexi bacterium CFX2]